MHIRQVHKITEICITHLPSTTKSYNVNKKIRLSFKMKLNRHRKILERYNRSKLSHEYSEWNCQNQYQRIRNTKRRPKRIHAKTSCTMQSYIHVHPSLVCTSRLQFTPIRLDLLNCHLAHQHQLSRYTKKEIQLNTNRNGAFINSDNCTCSELTFK